MRFNITIFKCPLSISLSISIYLSRCLLWSCSTTTIIKSFFSRFPFTFISNMLQISISSSSSFTKSVSVYNVIYFITTSQQYPHRLPVTTELLQVIPLLPVGRPRVASAIAELPPLVMLDLPASLVVLLLVMQIRHLGRKLQHFRV